ncbi:MAG: YqaE/Pmp3 family membrane protein [Flavobacteriales bacterium]|nr:YqaE/Pmp3 family membrane protein [Flavobacteriales bacterium]
MVQDQKRAKASSSQASDIVIALLCFFLPPIGVVVFENGVTGNFWLDLLLTLLFWLPGAVYAFLVCFADVSI